MRQATLSDFDIVAAISADAYRVYADSLGFVPMPAVEDYGPRIARGEVWILEDTREVVGLVVLEEHGDCLTVYSIAVRASRQHEGHGLALLRFAEKRASGIGAREIRLYTNELMQRNIAIYERFGFTIAGRRAHPSRPGHVLVDMVKILG